MVWSYVLLFVFIFVLTTSVLGRKNRFKSNFVKKFPRVKWTFTSLPFLDGCITLIKLRKDGFRLLNQLTEKYGKIFTIPLADTEALLVSDPTIIKQLLQSTDRGHLNKTRRLYSIIFANHLQDALVPSDVGIWEPHRKAISRAFTYSSFPTYFKNISDGAIELVQSACSIASKTEDETVSQETIGELIDHTVIKIATENVTGSSVVKIVSTEERAEMLEAFKRIKKISSDRMVRPAQLFPPVWCLHSKKRELDRAVEIPRRFFIKLANGYKTRDPLSASETEFGSAMEEMIKANFSDIEIAEEIAMLILAGYETVVTTLEFLLFHLAVNKQSQQKCHDEVDSFFGTRSYNRFELSDYSELKYLERCILEGLRLSPAIPAFSRTLTTSLQVSKEICIEAGTTVAISPWVVHRDPEIYPNPEKFEPDRFLPENIKKRPSHSFIPFSLGIRNCVGWKIALLELKVVMAWILKEFEFCKTEQPEAVRRIFGVAVNSELDYNVVLKRRTIVI